MLGANGLRFAPVGLAGTTQDPPAQNESGSPLPDRRLLNFWVAVYAPARFVLAGTRFIGLAALPDTG
jgi:hypothetical protein